MTHPPAERKLYGEAAPDDGAYHEVDPSTYRPPPGPPPSYLDTVLNLDTSDKSTETTTPFGDALAELSFDNLTVGFSSSLGVQSQPRTSARLEQQPQALFDPSHQLPEPSHRQVEHPPRLRPELPHPPQSAPDPRGRARRGHMDELQETDPFGNKFHDESPFEAARRAQHTGGGNPNDASPKGPVYAQGHMPSVRPGEIMHMRPLNGMPTVFPPLGAPPFPPSFHTPIRPAHFPTELHPGTPPSPPQPMRSHSHRLPGPPPPPTRSHSHRLPAPPPPPTRSHSYHSLQPQPRPADHIGSQPRAPPTRQPSLVRTPSQRHAAPPPLIPSHSPHGRPLLHPFTAPDGVPPGLTPTGRYPARILEVPTHLSSNGPPPQPHPSRTPSQVRYMHPPPRPRPNLKDQRHSLPARSPLVAPGPTPVRLPSQNVPSPPSSPPSTPGSHALHDIVHVPPVPSGPPRPDPSRPPRPPRPTPKPVMPQLLAPLAAQDHNFGCVPLQRSTSSVPLSRSGTKGGGGLLAKTKSILRKSNSSAGVRTHAPGAIAQPDPSKWYENQAPSLPLSVREDGAGAAKLGKRLSKRK